MRRLLLGIVITIGATALAVFPAGAGSPPTVSGAVTCGADGSATITWTFTMIVVETQIFNPEVVVSGAVSGGATFTPNEVDSGESATATTAVPAGVGGQVIITVPFREGLGAPSVATGAVNVACAPTPAEAVDAAPNTVG